MNTLEQMDEWFQSLDPKANEKLLQEIYTEAEIKKIEAEMNE